jgi:hypothetical protein
MRSTAVVSYPSLFSKESSSLLIQTVDNLRSTKAELRLGDALKIPMLVEKLEARFSTGSARCFAAVAESVELVTG